jgi:hypothetical protein
MPAAAQQMLLPFAALDFAGRSTVTLSEIALKLGGTAEHFAHLVDDGTLVAIDLSRHVGSRRMIRIPIEEYRRFVVQRLTGQRRAEFLAELTPATRLALAQEVLASLSPAERAALALPAA